MDYDLISSMKVEELKNYLKLWGLKVSGRKVELIARVFAASENNVPIIKTALEIEQELQEEYQNKLVIGNINIPDPFTLASGWLSEDDGRLFWPMVMYPDIFNYLPFYPSELASKDLMTTRNAKHTATIKMGGYRNLNTTASPVTTHIVL